MKKTRKLIPLGATISSLVMAAVLVVGAAAAQPDPFKGTWYSVDTDGSNQVLHIGGGPGSSHHAVYFDDGATVCGFDENGDFLAGASAVGALGLLPSGDTLAGMMPVYCLTTPRYLYNADAYFELTYQPGSDTLLDIHGVTWYR